ncbi:hypothetical protein KIN20_010826 [Parelaphostrongylus tenuis]|uniref:Uncharacterized protein n=1 Tax=Parelaphostrongylus tenuis TaxID=148309 RepID=A0AAD5QLN0_PARTN|nr:hypothetical protein KIN20_010826 [Parelaphostrongylus tenuis]
MTDSQARKIPMNINLKKIGTRFAYAIAALAGLIGKSVENNLFHVPVEGEAAVQLIESPEDHIRPTTGGRPQDGCILVAWRPPHSLFRPSVV